MKCAKCGKEIKVGSVYCQYCGEEAMIVSDYNVLEDEVLQSLLEDDDAFARRQAALKRKQEELSSRNNTETEENEPKKTGNFFIDRIWNIKKNRIAFIIVCIALVVLIAAILFFTSYTFKMIQGSNLDSKGKYEDAIEVYNKAIEQKKDSVEARVALGKDYIILERYDKAEEVLLEALMLDKESTEVYKALIILYSATSNSDKLLELEANAPNETIRQIFDSSVVTAPKASVEGGKYNEDQTVTLSCDKGSTIYYTIDGTVPDKSTGKLYSEPIKIESGDTTLKAISYDRDGEKSVVMTEVYHINYVAPDYPVVTPGSGHYDVPTTIRISTELEDAKIYYTWDGSIPTPNSERYVGPIDIPEGNNVLSVILVDKHGMSSNVFRANYEFTP